MLRYNLFNLLILFTFLLIVSCGKKEISLSQEVSSLPIEKQANLYNSQQPLSYKDEENIVEKPVSRKGLLSIFFKNSNNKLPNDNTKNVAKNNSLKKESSNNINYVDKTTKINTEQKINNKKVDEESTSFKDRNLINFLSSFLNFFTNNNPIIVKNIKYPVNALSVEDGLNLAVLKIPNNIYKKENNICYSEDTKLLKSIPTTLPKNISLNIINDPIYVDIFGIDNHLEANNISIQSNSGELTPSEIYKNYFIALKFEGLLTNYNELVPNKSLSLLHKTLISQILLKNENAPQVLYVFYRKTNQDMMSISSKQHLYLTSYLNNLRSYIYSKKVKNLYLQEVQFKDLPIDEILLILKPITIEQYNCLPKQVNVFNANKMNMKTWLNKNKYIGNK